MKTFILQLLVLISLYTLGIRNTYGQSNCKSLIEKATNEKTNYLRNLKNGRGTVESYKNILNSAKMFEEAIILTQHGSPEYEKCKKELRDLYPLLNEGAYFFAELDNQEKVLEYACSFIDISLLSAFANDGLQNTPTYPILANLAAVNLYNRGDYNRAINYFKAYLNTDDMQNRETAFEGLARCYYELKDFDWAAYIASQGVKFYPNNWSLLLIGIESYGKNNNDEKMAPLLAQALSIDPNHVGLLEYNGKLFERQHKFYKAAENFKKLYGVSNNNLDYACHYGFNLYNAAVEEIHKSKISTDNSANQISLNKAKTYMKEAANVLSIVLENNPYATNVARALAFCYSYNNDNERLTKTNSSLAALNVPKVKSNEIPKLDLSYTPTSKADNFQNNNYDNYQTQINPESIYIATTSDVDINIPQTGISNYKTYAVIIGNEDYKHHAKVNYAKNDAKVFSEYCNKTLGIPKDNIRELYNATYAEINEQIKYLAKRTSMEPGDLKIIFYYAGHGIPDVATGSAYILPSDVTGSDLESCYSLSYLYDQFDDMNTKQVTVFLDACFSGATRSNEMLFAERFVEYEVEDVVSKGNTIVFSAASGKQTAMGFDEEGHGFFTYYLLKILKDSQGDITYYDLGEKLRHQVETKAFDKKNKLQTPQVITSPALGNTWQYIKLIN